LRVKLLQVSTFHSLKVTLWLAIYLISVPFLACKLNLDLYASCVVQELGPNTLKHFRVLFLPHLVANVSLSRFESLGLSLFGNFGNVWICIWVFWGGESGIHDWNLQVLLHSWRRWSIMVSLANQNQMDPGYFISCGMVNHRINGTPSKVNDTLLKKWTEMLVIS